MPKFDDEQMEYILRIKGRIEDYIGEDLLIISNELSAINNIDAGHINIMLIAAIVKLMRREKIILKKKDLL